MIILDVGSKNGMARGRMAVSGETVGTSSKLIR